MTGARRRTRTAARGRARRRLGMGLMAFGAAGLVLIAAAGALVLASLSAVDDAATGFEEQRREILAMLGPASAALEGPRPVPRTPGPALPRPATRPPRPPSS